MTPNDQQKGEHPDKNSLIFKDKYTAAKEFRDPPHGGGPILLLKEKVLVIHKTSARERGEGENAPQQ